MSERQKKVDAVMGFLKPNAYKEGSVIWQDAAKGLTKASFITLDALYVLLLSKRGDSVVEFKHADKNDEACLDEVVADKTLIADITVDGEMAKVVMLEDRCDILTCDCEGNPLIYRMPFDKVESQVVPEFKLHIMNQFISKHMTGMVLLAYYWNCIHIDE